MLKKTIIYIFAVIAAVSLCAGCANKEKDTYDLDGIKLKENEIFLYNVSDQQLGSYNLNDFKWTPVSDVENVFQYWFQNDKTHFTSGHSLKNGFKAYALKDGVVETIMSLENSKDCFFPFAEHDGVYYYLMYEGESGKSIKRSVITLEDGKINTIFKSDQLISEGIVLGDDLYYSVYDASKDKYDIYKFNLTDKESVLVKNNIISGNLYVFNNELYFSDEEKIYNKSNEYEKKLYNFFIDEYNILIQFYENKNAERTCTVQDLKTGQVLYEVLNPLDFEIKDGMLRIYTHTGIKEYNL